MIRENRKKKNVYEGLRNNEGKFQLEIEKRISEPKWKSDISDYFRGVRGCGLSHTNKYGKRCKKKL